jgi:hypothetical protein
MPAWEAKGGSRSSLFVRECRISASLFGKSSRARRGSIYTGTSLQWSRSSLIGWAMRAYLRRYG